MIGDPNQYQPLVFSVRPREIPPLKTWIQEGPKQDNNEADGAGAGDADGANLQEEEPDELKKQYEKYKDLLDDKPHPNTSDASLCSRATGRHWQRHDLAENKPSQLRATHRLCQPALLRLSYVRQVSQPRAERTVHGRSNGEEMQGQRIFLKRGVGQRNFISQPC